MYKNNSFINRFDGHNKEKIKNFFQNLDKELQMNKKEKKKVFLDFENIISYYVKNNLTVNEIIKRLSLENVSKCYQDNNDWYYLDNSSKIYPLSMHEDWMSIYRLSYYLKDNIEPTVLQIALFYTVMRFPIFRTSLHKGFFWNYLDSINKHFKVFMEDRIPCSSINISKFNKESFKVMYFNNRISCEFFHLLTDANGGMVFLTTLVGEYLRLLGKKISYDNFCLNPRETYDKEEIIDMFKEVKLPKQSGSLVEKRALSLDGKLSKIQPSQVIHFDLDLEKVHALAKKNNATINELLLTYLFLVLSYSTSKKGDIKIQVPVNLRKFYKTKSLRNFSLYNNISLAKDEITNFDEVIKMVKKQSKEKLSKEVIDGVLYHSVSLVNKIKLLPLFIKTPIAKIIYRYFGDTSSTTVFSNLGKINLASELESEIIKSDFLLGTTLTNKVLFTCVSVNNILTMTIMKFTTNSSIENNLYNLLKDENLIISVHGSDKYEFRK